MNETGERNGRGFPIAAGILLGVGLGGFFDGIVLHQILQWHHMLSSDGYPPTSVHNLQVNTLWDGLFHAFAFVMTALGLIGGRVLLQAGKREMARPRAVANAGR